MQGFDVSELIPRGFEARRRLRAVAGKSTLNRLELSRQAPNARLVGEIAAELS